MVEGATIMKAQDFVKSGVATAQSMTAVTPPASNTVGEIYKVMTLVESIFDKILTLKGKYGGGETEQTDRTLSTPNNAKMVKMNPDNRAELSSANISPSAPPLGNLSTETTGDIMARLNLRADLMVGDIGMYLDKIPENMRQMKVIEVMQNYKNFKDIINPKISTMIAQNYKEFLKYVEVDGYGIKEQQAPSENESPKEVEADKPPEQV